MATESISTNDLSRIDAYAAEVQKLAKGIVDAAGEIKSAAVQHRIVRRAYSIETVAARIEWQFGGSALSPGARSQGSDLHARVAALGYELFETPDGRQAVLEYHESTYDTEGYHEAVFLHRDEGDELLEDWLARHEAGGTAKLGHEPDAAEQPRGNVVLSSGAHMDVSALAERAVGLAGVLSDTAPLSRYGIAVEQREFTEAISVLNALWDTVKRIDEILDGAEELTPEATRRETD